MIGRGLGQAGGRLNPNGLTAQAPLIDARGFIDEARGMASVGRSIQDIGGATMRLAEEQAQAVAKRQFWDTRRQIGSIQTEMGAALAAEPDEQKWPEILESHLDRARGLVNETQMMATAKEDASEYLAGWETEQRHNVSILHAKRSFARARESMQADLTDSVAKKNFGDARAIVESPQAEKYMGRDWVASAAANIDQAEQVAIARDRREAVEQDAAATPDMWLERNPEPGDMDPDDWQAGQAMARRVISARVSDAADEIGDGIATGKIKTAQDVEAVAAGRLGPSALERAKEDLRKMQSDAWRAENLSEKGVTKNFGLLLSEVDKYDKAADADGSKYARLVWQIKTMMPEELRGEITQPLARKWNPASGPDAPEPLRGFVRDTLRNWFDDGKFGQTKKRVPLAPEDRGWYKGTPEQKWVEDPVARDAAAARRGEAEMEMAKWLQENPTATIKEAKEQLLRSSSAALLPGDVSSLLRRPAPAAPVEDVGARLKEINARVKPGDFTDPGTGNADIQFPAGPGEIDPSLLPAIPFDE